MIRHRHRRRTAMRVLASAAVALTLAACGGDDSEDAGAAAEQPASAVGGDSAVEVDDTGGATAEASGGESAGGGAERVDLGSIGRDVIVEMRVSMSSDDIARSVSLISAKVAALGGGVATSEVDYGDPASEEPGGFAVLVLKVPPSAVNDLVGGLDDAGVVRSVAQSAQDVTDQLVDLDIRIDNARASVESVRQFMEATEDLSELEELARSLKGSLFRTSDPGRLASIRSTLRIVEITIENLLRARPFAHVPL